VIFSPLQHSFTRTYTYTPDSRKDPPTLLFSNSPPSSSSAPPTITKPTGVFFTSPPNLVVREHDPLGRDVELFRRHRYSAGKLGPTSKGSAGAELVDGLVIKEGDYKLDMGRLAVNLPPSKPIFIYSAINRPLFCVTSTTLQHQLQPIPRQQQNTENTQVVVSVKEEEEAATTDHHHGSMLLDLVHSILSKPTLDESKCKELLPNLSPHLFHSLFLQSLPSLPNNNPYTSLHFFQFASYSNFPFTLPSYCLLLRFLLSSSPSPAPAARLLLIRLIDSHLPVHSPSPPTPLDIAAAMADLNPLYLPSLAPRVSDLLVHVCATQFRDPDLRLALDVFRFLAANALFPSSKTCNFLLSSLVDAHRLPMAYQVFDVMRRGAFPLDVYHYSTMIHALFKGGRHADAIVLFSQMLTLGVNPNHVTYNNVIHGLCTSGRLEEAFRFKYKMARQKVNPSVTTYSILINGLMKLERIDEANSLLREMCDKGLRPNEIVYNTLIAGLCNTGHIDEALKTRDDMMSRGLLPNSATLHSLIQGLCKTDQTGHAGQVLEEMQSRGVPVRQDTFTSFVHQLCLRSEFDSAVSLIRQQQKLWPNDEWLTTLFTGLCEVGKQSEAVQLGHMLLDEDFVPKTVTSNALIHGLCEAGNMQGGVKLLQQMLERGLVLDKKSYDIIILACCRQGKIEEGIKLIKEEMVERGIQPDIRTYNLLLHELFGMGKIEEAGILWDGCKKNGQLPNIYTYGVMINGYCKANKVEEGEYLLNELVSKKQKLNSRTVKMEIWRRPSGFDVNDVLTATDDVIGIRLANPSKIAVLGGSQSHGFLTTHLNGQNHRYP
ncbi:hypothetical protein Tsubulata_014218, partial [Turnera subulata]